MEALATSLAVEVITKKRATDLVVRNHYLHRRPPISFCFALVETELTKALFSKPVVGVVTFGIPPSRHLQMSACKSDPAKVIELNRLWVDDRMPRNTETWFLSRALALLPPLIVVSYADTAKGHLGYIYRAANFHFSGYTDMERKTPRFDYVVPGKHSRDAFRDGKEVPRHVERVRRKPKMKYWTVTGNRRERSRLAQICTWPILDWKRSENLP